MNLVDEWARLPRPSGSYVTIMMPYKRDSPARPYPTTIKAMTDPPVKATRSATPRPSSLAAWAVRTLASVATRIPAQPVKALSAAPVKKAQPYRTPSKRLPVGGSTLYNKTNTTVTTTQYKANALYSVHKKDLAPDCICSEMRFILSFPLGARRNYTTHTPIIVINNMLSTTMS